MPMTTCPVKIVNDSTEESRNTTSVIFLMLSQITLYFEQEVTLYIYCMSRCNPCQHNRAILSFQTGKTIGSDGNAFVSFFHDMNIQRAPHPPLIL